MALRKWSIIEDELKKCQGISDPRFLRILGEFHERLREQHQTDVQLAEAYDTITNRVLELQRIVTGMDKALVDTGVKQKIMELMGQGDNEPGSEWSKLRENDKNRKN